MGLVIGQVNCRSHQTVQSLWLLKKIFLYSVLSNTAISWEVTVFQELLKNFLIRMLPSNWFRLRCTWRASIKLSDQSLSSEVVITAIVLTLLPLSKDRKLFSEFRNKPRLDAIQTRHSNSFGQRSTMRRDSNEYRDWYCSPFTQTAAWVRLLSLNRLKG